MKRLGGAYGAKIVLPLHLATAGAVAANKVKRPVRIWMPLEDNMKMLGKRNCYMFDYKVVLEYELIHVMMIYNRLVSHQIRRLLEWRVLSTLMQAGA